MYCTTRFKASARQAKQHGEIRHGGRNCSGQWHQYLCIRPSAPGADGFWYFLSFSANAAIAIMTRWTWPFRMTKFLTIMARKWFTICRPAGAVLFPSRYSAIKNIVDMARAWKSWANPQIIFRDFAKLLNKETTPFGSFSRTLLNLLAF